MKMKISAILVACYIVVGCSSGGGTSGASGGNALTVGSFLLTATLSMNGSASIDSIQDDCSDEEPEEPDVEEPVLVKHDLEEFTSRTGTFTITILNVGDLTGGLFPTGILLESYQVSFTPFSPGAPGLSKSPVYPNPSSTINGATSISTVVIVDAASVLPEYQAKNPAGVIHNYVVTVNMRGRTLAGDPFVITATMLIEFGNFDTCGGD